MSSIEAGQRVWEANQRVEMKIYTVGSVLSSSTIIGAASMVKRRNIYTRSNKFHGHVYDWRQLTGWWVGNKDFPWLSFDENEWEVRA